MQSNRLNRRLAAVTVALTLLFTVPAFAAPPGGAAWADFPGLEVLWTRVASALGAWFGANGQVYDPNGLTAEPPSRDVTPAPMDRIFGANGQVYDPDGSPSSTSAWEGAPTGVDCPTSSGETAER